MVRGGADPTSGADGVVPTDGSARRDLWMLAWKKTMNELVMPRFVPALVSAVAVTRAPSTYSNGPAGDDVLRPLLASIGTPTAADSEDPEC